MSNFIFVHSWESQRQEILGIGVEVAAIFCNCLPQLLFLELPYIQLLTRVRKNFYTVR
jgi:hypothetical protein